MKEAIDPAAAHDLTRPNITFALLAYNQECSVKAAIEGALSQTYQPLEIILSDDFSSDRTFAVMEEAVGHYAGPHEVKIRRNPKNLGIGCHVSEIFRVATGKLIVLAAGDDISEPTRVKDIVDAWSQAGCSTAVICSNFSAIDSTGREVESAESRPRVEESRIQEMALGHIGILGATTAYTPDVMTRFPPLHRPLVYEDRVLPFRVLLLGGSVIRLNEKLVRYRIAGGISRSIPSSAEEYLFETLRKSIPRTKVDARQRLRDAAHVCADNRDLLARCRRRWVTEIAISEMLKPGSRSYETRLVRGLRWGSGFSGLLKVYLKCRLLFLFSIYYRIVHGPRIAKRQSSET
jgi:glycosyltransferase involved in cell wall biosynthesis